MFAGELHSAVQFPCFRLLYRLTNGGEEGQGTAGYAFPTYTSAEPCFFY